MIDKDSLPLDKPRRTPDHPTKSHVVKTRVDGKEKIIRFGEQGASTAGKPKEGESDAMKQKRASFKARHAKNIAKGKSSPAYWADKVKWKTGGAVGLEELDEKYEGIKKPDFSLLESFQDLIRTLQSKAADAGTQEFDPVRALGRSGAAGSLEDLYEAYADEPRPHAARVEAGGNANPDRAKTAKMVFDSFKAAGFSDAQAKALTAEINREGSFNPAYLYGSHTDAANKATNVGMLSWQGDRADRLMSFMADRGLIDPAGRIVPGQEALNAQAMYLRDEMENDPSYARTRETFLGNPNIDPDAAHDILGKNFIRWRIDDPKYRGSGFDRISEGYDILNMAQGFAEGGLAELTQKYAPGGVVEEDELAEAERLRDLQLMAEERNPNAVAPRKPSIADLPGGVVDRLALINKYLNPVEAIGESMRAGSRLTSDDASGYDRLAALGDMLSGVAGVAGPAAIAKRVGAPAATALMESLLGASPTTQAAGDTMRAVGRDVLERLNQRGPVPVMYSNPIAGMARKYAVDESGALPGMGRGAGVTISDKGDNVFDVVVEVRYIQDRTVIEDTESSVDLVDRGWKLYNYPERLAYSATPPDFGSLVIQRRRWANGGLIILPKLVRYLLRGKASRGEGFMRFHYLASIAAVNAGLLILLAVPFTESISSIWLPLTALPYFVLYGRDLTRIGYRVSDLFRVYALNLLTIPVNLGGVLKSLQQAWTKAKIPFGRTPKVAGRTAAPALYVLAGYALLAQWLVAAGVDMAAGRWPHGLFALVNSAFLLYALLTFIGLRESREDLRAGLGAEFAQWFRRPAPVVAAVPQVPAFDPIGVPALRLVATAAGRGDDALTATVPALRRRDRYFYAQARNAQQASGWFFTVREHAGSLGPFATRAAAEQACADFLGALSESAEFAQSAG